MSRSVEEIASPAPRKDQTITYRGTAVGTVARVEENLCWVRDATGVTEPFIWRFKDGLNALHEWPGKAGKLAFCPGVTP